MLDNIEHLKFVVWLVYGMMFLSLCHLIIYYDFRHFRINKESNQDLKIDLIISELKRLNVDGETTQYILQEIDMEYQMLSQLLRTYDKETIQRILNEI